MNVKKLKRKPEEAGMMLLGAGRHLASVSTKKIHGTHWIHLQTVAVICSQADTQGKIFRYSDKSRRAARFSYYDKVWMTPPAMITRSG